MTDPDQLFRERMAAIDEAHYCAGDFMPPPASDSHASVSPEQTPSPADDSAHRGDHSTVGGTP